MHPWTNLEAQNCFDGSDSIGVREREKLDDNLHKMFYIQQMPDAE